MLQFVNTVHRKIREENLVSADKRLLASISGGQDSMCLLITLYVYTAQIELGLDLIWLNHFWQRSSFFAMAHISKLSHSLSFRALLSIPLIKLFSEESARDWRRSATQRAHLFYQYDLCAQGHSKSDRVETVLFNLIRGAGLPGVSALSWTTDQACFSRNSLYPLFSQLLKQTHVQRVGRAGVAVPCSQRRAIKIYLTQSDVCVYSGSSERSLCCTVDLNPRASRSSPLNRLGASQKQKIEIAHFQRKQSRARNVQAMSSFSKGKICTLFFQHPAIQALKRSEDISLHRALSEDNVSLPYANDSRLIKRSESYYYQLKQF